MLPYRFVTISIFQHCSCSAYISAFFRPTMALQLPNRNEIVYKDYTYQGCPLPGEDDHHCHLTPSTVFITYGWWNENTNCNDYSLTMIPLPPNFRGAICSLQLRNSKWVVDIFEADRQTYITYDLSTRELREQGRLDSPVTDEDLVN